MKKVFTCNCCSNHCQTTYTPDEKTLAEVHGYLCPKGMLSLVKELLPMNNNAELENEKPLVLK